MTRIRQAVLAAADLDGAVVRLRDQLDLGEPFNDPAVDHFGLRNAVFAIGDTFLEVVSPVREDASAARLIERRGGDCGYMVMFQVPDVAEVRARAEREGVREVFAVDLDDIAESHFHPSDIGGAIVSASTPAPAAGWRWGGPRWAQRSVPGRVAGITVSVTDPEAVEACWRSVLGEIPGVRFVGDRSERGIVAIEIERDGSVIEIEP